MIKTVRTGAIGRRTERKKVISMSKKYRAVLLDLDGTLMDTSEGIFSSIRHATDVMHLPYPDPETLNTFIGPPIVKSMERVYGMPHEEALRANEAFQEAYRGGDVMKAHCYPGIMGLLRWLRGRGVKVGVATLKPIKNARGLLEKNGITEFCDYVSGSDMNGKMTKQDVIRLCISHLGVSPEETVHIGDTDYDAEGAADEGVDFIAVCYGFGPSDKEYWERFNPVAVVDSADEIRTFLEGCLS